jgi:hypothetical protein
VSERKGEGERGRERERREKAEIVGMLEQRFVNRQISGGGRAQVKVKW